MKNPLFLLLSLPSVLLYLQWPNPWTACMLALTFMLQHLLWVRHMQEHVRQQALKNLQLLQEQFGFLLQGKQVNPEDAVHLENLMQEHQRYWQHTQTQPQKVLLQRLSMQITQQQQLLYHMQSRHKNQHKSHPRHPTENPLQHRTLN